MRRAVIDIGTNTVKLLIADVHHGLILPVVSKDVTTRLGEGLHRGRQLSPAAVARTVEAVAGYVADAREHAVAGIRALATSAVRDATNRDAFVAAVRDRCGLPVEVISGDQEAALIFQGVTSDPAFAGRDLLVMDVGGGSAEFICGRAGQIERHQSLPVGAVRLTEQFGDDFPALAAFLRTTFRAALRDYRAGGRHFVATGGANTTLVRVATGRVDHAALGFDEVMALVARLHAMTLAQRRQLPGLPADRADIIVAGAAALAFAMEATGATRVTVSTRNLRFGALLAGAPTATLT
jgi:exopolyphosphatase/guanosine-5'-triphosphate,3'-diphosphate pyrophosphatase